MSGKISSSMPAPRSVPFIMVSITVLAVFLLLGSRILVSYPGGSTLGGNLLGVDPSRMSLGSEERGVESTPNQDQGPVSEMPNNPDEKEAAVDTLVSPTHDSEMGRNHAENAGNGNSSRELTSQYPALPAEIQFPVRPVEKVRSEDCDLFEGKWVYDSSGPLYTNNTCPMITQMQNCQGNGRPDKDYENWRWKPSKCDLPQFDGRKFLELMKGKTLAFIGDSVARNQMESLMCLLWQVEVPTNRGNRRMKKYLFRSTSTNIVRIWSSWLVHKTSEAFKTIPEGVTKVHLDRLDEDFMEFLPRFDVIVLSSGHWFAKQSAYILNGEIVGGQLWWPKDAGEMNVNNVEAFGVSVENALLAIASHPNFTGLVIIRTFSPDHYEGGAWNTGGSCTGKVDPASEVVRNGFTDTMHEKQVMGFRHAAERVKGAAKLRLMDITEAFGYRHDGHPGPYRSPDPNKITKRGPDGKPPPQDCLHWCMPGPVDTWNEIMLEIIRREFE